MKTKKVNAERFRASALFECLECVEQWQDLATSRQEAYQHTQKTGHKTSGEIETAYHYQSLKRKKI